MPSYQVGKAKGKYEGGCNFLEVYRFIRRVARRKGRRGSSSDVCEQPERLGEERGGGGRGRGEEGWETREGGKGEGAGRGRHHGSPPDNLVLDAF